MRRRKRQWCKVHAVGQCMRDATQHHAAASFAATHNAAPVAATHHAAPFSRDASCRRHCRNPPVAGFWGTRADDMRLTSVVAAVPNSRAVVMRPMYSLPPAAHRSPAPRKRRRRENVAVRAGDVIEFNLVKDSVYPSIGRVWRVSGRHATVDVFMTREQHRRYRGRRVYVVLCNIHRLVPAEPWHETATLPPDEQWFRRYERGAEAVIEQWRRRCARDRLGRVRRAATRAPPPCRDEEIEGGDSRTSHAHSAADSAALSTVAGSACGQCGDGLVDLVLVPCSHLACSACLGDSLACNVCGSCFILRMNTHA
jgi:hypothetical protein